MSLLAEDFARRLLSGHNYSAEKKGEVEKTPCQKAQVGDFQARQCRAVPRTCLSPAAALTFRIVHLI
jgi:hypothetical protein